MSANSSPTGNRRPAKPFSGMHERFCGGSPATRPPLLRVLSSAAIGVPPPIHIEHIVARQHGGPTRLDNLALAGRNCNLKKGPDLSGVDTKDRSSGGACPSSEGRMGRTFLAGGWRSHTARRRHPRFDAGWTGDGSGTWAKSRDATTDPL